MQPSAEVTNTKNNIKSANDAVLLNILDMWIIITKPASVHINLKQKRHIEIKYKKQYNKKILFLT